MQPGSSKRRLTIALSLFFLALAIPAAILVIQASSQMKWEAFHQQRSIADELVNRIDRQYKTFIDEENARPFTDYSFLNVVEDSKINPLQRSPLSVYPLKSSIAGVVGYFQIDSEGRFSTPLLPQDNASLSDYGLSKKELQSRKKDSDKLYLTLKENQLIQKSQHLSAGNISKVRPEPSAPSIAAQTDTSSRTKDVLSEKKSSRPDDQSQGDIRPRQKLVESQAAFDKLKESVTALEDSVYDSRLGRVEDLKLEGRYGSQLKQKAAAPQKKENKSKRVLRKERNVLPTEQFDSGQTIEKPGADTIGVNIFESEIDTFEFSLLKSGHFVLYRKVWRADQRYIQGVLLDAKQFIAGVIADSYKASLISKSSDLVVAFEGNVLSVLKAGAEENYIASNHALKGTLLLDKNLALSMPQLQLIFSVNQLPAGPGGVLVGWLSLVLLLVLLVVFFWLYRLGAKQIELVQQQQNFVSAVSHELKTPLTSIRMYGEMLREGWVNDEKKKLYYDYIYDESERLSRLINNVLQLARMTRNEIRPDLKSITVAELLDIVRSKTSQLFIQNAFTLHIENDQGIEQQVVEVDVDYFTQIMINLIDNAIKFSASAEKKQVVIGCRYTGTKKLTFYVRDYGPGIGKDQSEKIFNLFYRGEHELTRDSVGTGIGLALVSQLMQSMQAEVAVKNCAPGVEFTLSFGIRS